MVEDSLDFVGAEFDAGHERIFGDGDDVFVVELFGGSGADEDDFVGEGAGFEVAFDDIDEGNVAVRAGRPEEVDEKAAFWVCR